MSPLKLVPRFWRQCSRRRRWQLAALLALMLASALAEIASLGALLPFITALNARYALLFVVAALAAAGVRLALVWFNYRFTAAFGTELAIAAYRRALYQPYAEHLKQNSSTLVALVARKVDVCVNTGVVYLLFLCSSLVLVVAVTGALLVINPRVALLSIGVLGGLYALVSWRVHRRLESSSRVVALEQERTLRALQEGFGGVRDIVLHGEQEAYSRVFGAADFRLRRAQGIGQFTGAAPRYFMEALGIALIAALAWRMSLQGGGLQAALPALAALALGAQRLVPAMQLAFNAWTNLVSNADSMAETLDLLEQPMATEDTAAAPEPLDFRQSIALRGVSFRYRPDGPAVLRNVNLEVARGERVGIIGASGSGKSTLLDLLMGLLDPVAGQLLVDAEPVTGRRRRAWQRAIAHVPQSIFLADTSLAENIAFGVPAAQIDLKRVREAARLAQLAEFIDASPEGYATRVGERGVRLSGGQRQRVGIARALYRRPQVLVLDEATNALDDATEQGVLQAIADIGRSVTVLIIAHRPSTIAACDRVVILEDGQCRS